MEIAAAVRRQFPELNSAQRKIIRHDEGPLLVIAGPGSGKTYSLILRALNLLLLGKAVPKQLVLCTFTQKAAYELRDRLSAAAQKMDYSVDLGEAHVSTIHSFCHEVLVQHLHRTRLGHSFETLDDLTQSLFIFEHFDEIIGPETDGGYLGKWHTRWTAIDGVKSYFNKITEELVDPGRLVRSRDAFIVGLGRAYRSYRRALLKANRLDFAHLQHWVLQLLRDRTVADQVTRDIRYVMVDEYQDTNYIQEQLLFKLTEKTGNLCVVGDEDQSLYRFRGATVRNILEFPTRSSGCKIIKLTTNYRSHRRIIRAYDRWMASADWSNPGGLPFRHDKRIEPDPETRHRNYPAVFSIWGRDPADEARRFADLVTFLKRRSVIQDYSQLALLLHSVRQEHSGHYLETLRSRGIPAFCPRARAYFDNEEVRLMVGCLALIFGWHGKQRGNLAGATQQLAEYTDDAIAELAKRFAHGRSPLARLASDAAADIEALKPGGALDLRPADYFYRLLSVEPFLSFVNDENKARNLAILSQLLNAFQNYYHHTVVTYRNREILRLHLFNSFLRLLYEGGINEYEDPDQPFPKGHVQVMTIHQAKGLEFPVVVVGSLSRQLSSPKQVDRDLQSYYHRPPLNRRIESPPSTECVFTTLRFPVPRKSSSLRPTSRPRPISI